MPKNCRTDDELSPRAAGFIERLRAIETATTPPSFADEAVAVMLEVIDARRSGEITMRESSAITQEAGRIEREHKAHLRVLELECSLPGWPSTSASVPSE